MTTKWRRIILRRFFVFFMLFLAARACAAQNLSISFPRKITVSDTAFSIADVAEIDGPRDLADMVGSLILSAADGVITRQQVIDVLKVSGIEGVNISLRMTDSVIVEKLADGESGEPAVVALPASESDVSDKKLSSMIKELAMWDGDVQVSYQGKIPEGRLVAPASIVPGTPAVTLKFQNKARAERSLGVRLIWYQPVLVLTRSVSRGQILKESDFATKQIRVNKPGVYASSFQEAAGRSLRKNLSQGEPIALDLLFDMPIIERGSKIVLVVRDGSVVVQTKGEAMESGAAGEVIKVRNIASKTVLTGVVIDKDTVEVKIP